MLWRGWLSSPELLWTWACIVDVLGGASDMHVLFVVASNLLRWQCPKGRLIISRLLKAADREGMRFHKIFVFRIIKISMFISLKSLWRLLVLSGRRVEILMASLGFFLGVAKSTFCFAVWSFLEYGKY